jgi:hypothetical protein
VRRRGAQQVIVAFDFAAGAVSNNGGSVASTLLLGINRRASQRGMDNARCHTACSTEDAWALRRGTLLSCYNTPDGHPHHNKNSR